MSRQRPAIFRPGSAPVHGTAASARWRLALALGVILLAAWTQVFLGIHELSHLGQADASTCRFAQVTSTCSAGAPAAALALPAPPAQAPEYLPLPAQPRAGAAVIRQARSPPVPA